MSLSYKLKNFVQPTELYTVYYVYVYGRVLYIRIYMCTYIMYLCMYIRIYVCVYILKNFPCNIQNDKYIFTSRFFFIRNIKIHDT